ncbi:TetR/AcrR family transcriptional regulator [Iamia sp. SCSIO 61187]|uniref:TetR/AcrR family transcriptional regulator n=1 Tax=Iamia sp. SCSIO 61187 TaxID=2722752 RepID=UPI001C630C4C|nr:TetR/AcrR family transcriptional regulator [Iamia sp. SCSIO 61187]QYG91912.1 TetR/AcrR family transcriptional regulator [Iamia sp. SCSIO 61187]
MDPRIARTQQAVMDAATELLVEGGPAALTMDAVVARSGVAKSTLYRHWETRDALLAAVFTTCKPAMGAPADATSCEEGLRALVRTVADALTDESWSRLAPALILLSKQHPELAQVDSDMKRTQHEATEAVLRMGVEEGLLDPSVLDDVERAVALVAGPVVFAGLADMTEIDDALVDTCVTQFLAGHRAEARS